MNDLSELETLASNLLARTLPAERRQLLRTIAREVQRSQRERIGRQRDPEGEAFAPRKATGKLRRGGSIKRAAMFRKLRSARHLKAGGTTDEAWIGFAGRAARIAGIHQRGLSDRPAAGQAPVPYPRRVLLGPTEAERGAIADRLLAHLL